MPKDRMALAFQPHAQFLVACEGAEGLRQGRGVAGRDEQRALAVLEQLP